MGKRNSTPMTAERILGYLNAVHAAITHKRVPLWVICAGVMTCALIGVGCVTISSFLYSGEYKDG